MKKNLKRTMAVFLLTAILAGCSSPPASKEPVKEADAEETAEPAAGEEKKLIGINIGAPDAEFFQMVEFGLKKACEERGWEYLMAYGMNEKVTENTSTFLAQNVDAIVDFGCSAEYGNTAVKLAEEKDVPFITIDVDYEGAYFFGANNQLAGECVGEALAAWVKENWNGEIDAIWAGYTERTGAEVRKRVSGAIEKIYADLGITSGDVDEFWYDSSVGEIEGAKQSAIDYMSAHPDYDKVIFICESSSWIPSVLGGLETIGAQDKAILGAHNEDTWTISHFKETESSGSPYIATTTYQPFNYGDYVGKMLDQLFAGEEVDKFTYLEHEALTRSNYKEYEAVFEEFAASK